MATCFADVCPAATNTDLLVYRLDGIAWMAVGIIGLVAAARPHRGMFVALALLGLCFAAQGVAGFLGARGFYAFPLILPAAALLIIASRLGVRATSAWAHSVGQSATDAFAMGCAIYFLSYSAFFGLASAASGQIVGLLLAVLVVALVGMLVRLIARRTEVPRSG
jgi:hypothetical protein